MSSRPDFIIYFILTKINKNKIELQDLNQSTGLANADIRALQQHFYCLTKGEASFTKTKFVECLNYADNRFVFVALLLLLFLFLFLFFVVLFPHHHPLLLYLIVFEYLKFLHYYLHVRHRGIYLFTYIYWVFLRPK